MSTYVKARLEHKHVIELDGQELGRIHLDEFPNKIKDASLFREQEFSALNAKKKGVLGTFSDHDRHPFNVVFHDKGAAMLRDVRSRLAIAFQNNALFEESMILEVVRDHVGGASVIVDGQDQTNLFVSTMSNYITRLLKKHSVVSTGDTGRISDQHRFRLRSEKKVFKQSVLQSNPTVRAIFDDIELPLQTVLILLHKKCQMCRKNYLVSKYNRCGRNHQLMYRIFRKIYWRYHLS